MESPSGSIEARCERLEHRLRRTSGVLAMLLLLVLALLAWEFLPVHHVVEARRFVLKDKAGRERGEFTAWSDGAVGLRLNNKQEKARVMLRLDAEGFAHLKFTDGRGVNRAELVLEGEGSPVLYLAGRDGGTRSMLRVAGEGAEEGLVVRDGTGSVRLSVP